MAKTITFRTTATITVSDTVENAEYFKTLMSNWDESSATDRLQLLWQMMADKLPSCVDKHYEFSIVLKNGNTVTPANVVVMSAAELVSNGIFS